MTEPVLRLRAGRDKTLNQRHPWVFSGSVDSVRGDPATGDTVRIVGPDGEFLARAAWNPDSRIAARVWSLDSDERIDAAFFDRRIREAVARRDPLRARTDALRLVNAEGDGLPGLIADQYGDMVCAQFQSAGAERWRGEITAALLAASGARRILDRSDESARKLEGLQPPPRQTGSEPGTEEEILIRERLAEDAEPREIRFALRPEAGQKTGFYLDQRDNRRAFAEHARGREVLDAFSYTGGFGLAALAGGATSATLVDSSAPALVLAGRNLNLNNMSAERIEADVFAWLRSCRDSRRTFDLISLDPPKFAMNRSQTDRAARAYKDINRLAMLLLRPGGTLFTFSCSAAVNPDLFQKICFAAATDAGREMQITARLTQPADHPVRLSFPEGEYLKGLVLRV